MKNSSFLGAELQYKKKKYNEALIILNELITHAPNAKTYALLGDVLKAMGMVSEAAESYRLAAEQTEPANVIYLQRALTLYKELERDDDALLTALRIYNANPTHLDAAFTLCFIYTKRGEYELARIFAPALSSSTQPQHFNLACVTLGWHVTNSFEKQAVANMFRKFPDNPIFRMMYLHFLHADCNYDETKMLVEDFSQRSLIAKQDIIHFDNPFHSIHWCGDESLVKHSGTIAFRTRNWDRHERLTRTHSWATKLRIGYVSSDFYDTHATMKLVREIFERHDNARFDITYFCHSDSKAVADSGFSLDKFGAVIRLNTMSDAEAAEAIQAANIDILVDLKGHTSGSRPSIFNFPCAPVHVSWLGFPGTTVNIDLDYIIGDRFVLPDDAEPHYWESFCRLPESYQPNSPRNRPLPPPEIRSEAGLSDDKFVFASFNAGRKITAVVLDTWINILKRAPNSVLWIMVSSENQQKNISKRIKRGGIALNRVIFTVAANYAYHIARLQAADLALDTYPVNGHTTTSEKLWAGLPVLTVKGSHFASRVSESLLNAIGLEGLVAEDFQAYEDRAVELYENPDQIKAYKEQLVQNRFIKPLFDAERFTRHLETAYEMMADRARRGLEPALIDVPALPPRTEPFMTR